MFLDVCVAISAAIYRGGQMPDTQTSRKTAEKGAEWVAVKTAKKQPEEQQPKHPKNSCFDSFSGGTAVLPAALPRSTRHPFRPVFNVGHLPPL